MFISSSLAVVEVVAFGMGVLALVFGVCMLRRRNTEQPADTAAAQL